MCASSFLVCARAHTHTQLRGNIELNLNSTPQPGTASLLNFAFLTERLRFFLTLRLLCLTVLVLGALLSSFLEEALYKCSI